MGVVPLRVWGFPASSSFDPAAGQYQQAQAGNEQVNSGVSAGNAGAYTQGTQFVQQPGFGPAVGVGNVQQPVGSFDSGAAGSGMGNEQSAQAAQTWGQTNAASVAPGLNQQPSGQSPIPVSTVPPEQVRPQLEIDEDLLLWLVDMTRQHANYHAWADQVVSDNRVALNTELVTAVLASENLFRNLVARQ